jgi:ubiquitin-like-conjugating enzyme ATG10
MLTRSQFDAACKQFIAKYATSTDHSQVTEALKGWVWNEHPVRHCDYSIHVYVLSCCLQSMPAFGYMSRSVIHTWRFQPLATETLPPDSDLDDAYHEDDATALTIPVNHESLIAQQWIVYSATFQVPAFYFTMHNSSL